MTAAPPESHPGVPPARQEAERGRVLDFRRPRGAVRPGAQRRSPLVPPLLDLGKYEQPADRDDYRQRMLINSVGMAISVLLILTGLWLATRIAELRRDTDCLLSGRRNCDALSINRSMAR